MTQIGWDKREKWFMSSPSSGLDRSVLKDHLANGMARRYKPGSGLPRHVETWQRSFLQFVFATDLLIPLTLQKYQKSAFGITSYCVLLFFQVCSASPSEGVGLSVFQARLPSMSWSLVCSSQDSLEIYSTCDVCNVVFIKKGPNFLNSYSSESQRSCLQKGVQCSYLKFAFHTPAVSLFSFGHCSEDLFRTIYDLLCGSYPGPLCTKRHTTVEKGHHMSTSLCLTSNQPIKPKIQWKAHRKASPRTTFTCFRSRSWRWSSKPPPCLMKASGFVWRAVCTARKRRWRRRLDSKAISQLCLEWNLVFRWRRMGKKVSWGGVLYGFMMFW